MVTKGIILAGGLGSRLMPITQIYSKQLTLVYDKPLIYYPLTTLILMGVTDVNLVCNSANLSLFQNLLGNGCELGLSITYSLQERPTGIAEAPLIASQFLGGDDFYLILGDNILIGNNTIETIKSDLSSTNYVYAHRVSNPEAFGVASFDSIEDRLIAIEEKPSEPASDWALIGLYKYSNDVIEICRQLEPSKRNELEITDLNNCLLQANNLRCIRFGRGVSWFDAGSFDGLYEASTFIRSMQQRQGGLLGSPEEAAFRTGLINHEMLLALANKNIKSSYGLSLMNVLKNS